MSFLADVAVPLGVDRVFTYLVPPGLHESARVGTRAIVPLGRRYVTGLIVGRPEESSLPSLKPIRDVIDPAPILPEELLHLCRWVAEYYFAPLGEVLKSALPAAFTGPGKRLATAAVQASDSAAVELKQHSPVRWKILSYLLTHGPTLSSDLQKRTGTRNINAHLNDLARQGFLIVEDLAPPATAKPRTVPFLLVERVDPARLADSIRSLPARNRRTLRLLQHVQSLHNSGITEVTTADLLRASGVPSSALRPLVRSGLLPVQIREVTRGQDYEVDAQTLSVTLNEDQRRAFEAIVGSIDSGSHRTFLLHGVTGSGKTQVYIEAIRHCLDRDKTAIVLVPEISLTPQTVRRFRAHFGDRVAAVHSRMSPAERHDVWRLALRGDYRVVIGPRSAIFVPLRNPGLIVVDEEHEASYKQYDAVPRYHARDTAIVRGLLSSTTVVLGSATPSVESSWNAASGKYQLLEMPRRVDQVRMPDIGIVDMTAERRHEYAAMKESLPPEQRRKLKEFRQSALSSSLRASIEDRLKKREGIIILQNRRGFAPFVECMECGHTEMCDRCNVTLTYHLVRKHLRCHYCGLVRTPPAECPQCHGVQLQLRGIGTQRVEEELVALFPTAHIARMDLDTTSRKGAHERILRRFADGDTDILLGTQMVAKGLDFPRVTLVGVISADTQMLLPDFRSSERTFQLLTQVAGRSGRSSLHGEVVIQTHQPQHYTLKHVVDHDYRGFLEEELVARRELSYPPFSRLVLIEVTGRNEVDVRKHAERLSHSIERSEAFSQLGPSPAVIGRIREMYRWHLLLKNNKTTDPSGARMRAAVRRALEKFEPARKRSVRIVVDVDPVGLL